MALRRRQWRTLLALTGIGALSAASLVIYLHIIFQGTPYAHLTEWPNFGPSILWNKVGGAVTALSSGEVGRNGPEIWLWIALLLGGIIAARLVQRNRVADAESNAPRSDTPDRRDLALYCMANAILGVIGLCLFFLWLHYLTQSWYYIGLLCLCAISFDGNLGAKWPALRPWGLLRIGFMLSMLAWTARAGWQEAHTRRSNMDLIAALLEKDASAKDLIVVQTSWEGITFNRYYHGAAPWVTVPPINSHLVHRNDLVLEKMRQPEPMAPVLRAMTNTLASGHNVWLLGNMTGARPVPPQPGDRSLRMVNHFSYWNAQVSATLLDHALAEQVVEIPTGAPVFCQENLPLIRFAGYGPGNSSTNAVAH